MKKYPKRVYLRWEGHDPFYLIGHPSISDTAGGENINIIGVYELVSEIDVKQPVQYRPKGTKTWTEAKE